MFTDMVGYTTLTQSNEPLALGLLETQSGILLPLIRTHGGTPVKTIGDAHLAEFGSALEAVRCAMDIQRRLGDYARSVPSDQAFKLRIGVHVGDVVHREHDVFGDAVNIASRIEPLAEPGGVCISQQVYDQVQNKVEFKFEKLPTRQLKNVSVSIDVYKVTWTGSEARPRTGSEMMTDRVAVLPLSNFSPSQQDEYLADGMTEELITAISGIKGLRVIARTSVMRFKGSQVDIAEIGRSLNVGSVLEGSFRKIGERIRVTVQLIDARTEEHRWASNYDGDMKDIFSIQTDIANKVAEALKLKLLDGGSSPKVVNIEAYELYLRGRQFWNRRNAEGVAQALKLFKAAAEKDQTYGNAYSGIADCYAIGADLGLFKHEEAGVRAEEAVHMAIQLDDSNAEAHASRGLMLTNQNRFLEARDEFMKAVALNPSYPSAHHWYAICLSNLGRLDEAIEEANLASQADPLAGPSRNILGVVYIYSRQFDRALAIFNDILKLDPGFTQSLSWRANVYSYKGMEKEAVRDFDSALAGATDYERDSTLAYVKAWFGHEEEASRHFELAAKTAQSETLVLLLKAYYSAVRGEADGFFTGIEEVRGTPLFSPCDVRYAWWLDKVRGDPRFSRLLASLPS
jgi:adenylate cyclase